MLELLLQKELYLEKTGKQSTDEERIERMGVSALSALHPLTASTIYSLLSSNRAQTATADSADALGYS
jgi:hypothetical protein